MDIGISYRNYPGETECGDQCAVFVEGNSVHACVLDGLGHGLEAKRAADAAYEYLKSNLAKSLTDIFKGCDKRLNETRGVAMGLLKIDRTSKQAEYAGIGNTRCLIFSDTVNRLSSGYGIVGGGYKRLFIEMPPLNTGDLILLFSDGIDELIDLEKYEDLQKETAQCLAERMIQDWATQNDDAGLLVLRL
jgi:negative regulator of sigma-B (phosphoserine phosphatase)